ncbi:hypothetical protein BpHYR1_028991 [Brachionus plicatilis]|uniref:Uncharacterized protein n=1 Tax=Brachionus plicatilis TaxID=10195 RepID=A0A3M7RP01_BRAPC|nr:hypothetical protein BpHYR1_028991 [Brachionus plicatilis]
MVGFKFYKFKISENLVNKNLFKNTKNLKLEGILDKIEKNSFTQLYHLESLEILNGLYDEDFCVFKPLSELHSFVAGIF